MSNHASAEHEAQHHQETSLGLDNRKLAFWLFLASECVFFASLIIGYLTYKGKSLSGPFPRDIFDIPLTTGSSFILLMSSLTMVLAVYFAHHGNMRAMRVWLGATILLGLNFLFIQAYEFTHFGFMCSFDEWLWDCYEGAGLTLKSSVFGSSFYTLTGFHGLHVLGGVIWLLSALIASFKKGALSNNPGLDIEIAGLYWHFVDVVWIVIFTVVYLVEFAP